MRSRRSRTQAKLKYRYVQGFWVREDAISGIVAELETRSEYRDVEMSQKRWDKLIAEAVQRLVEERFCSRKHRK